MKIALISSLLALGVFWLVVYRSGPVVSIAVVLEAALVIALAFAYASRSLR
jgi:hypothetical protein